MESFVNLFDPEQENSQTKKQWLKCEIEIDMTESDNKLGSEILDKLPPEPEQGNVEYKLKLINPSSDRFEHLVTQMKWRLREGHGEAVYQIGVEDSGKLTGLTKKDMNASLKTLGDMASRLGAKINVLRERTIYPKDDNLSTLDLKRNKVKEKKIAEVLVRKMRKGDRDDHESVTDLRLAVMGGQDVGKSTLLGVLTQGELDNGRGRSRLNVLRHLHEIKSGRTSSISHEIIGFDNKGHILNYADMTTAEEICEHASKVVTFIDLAGHRKYLRTTILGLTGYSPHYVMLVVAPQITEVFHEHLDLCLALQLPFFVVITKVDLGVNFEEILRQLKTISDSHNLNKMFMLHCNNNENISSNNFIDVIPVFAVSCVTGEGLDDLTNFIKDLSPSGTVSVNSDPSSCLFQIDETFRVAGCSDPVLGGLLVKGAIRLGSKLLVGPSPSGKFIPVKVVSLHRNKAPCCFVRASQSASLIIAPLTKRQSPLPHLRPGMVLVSSRDRPRASLFFQASILVVYHTTAIYPGFQATVHIGNIRQTCVIEGIMDIKENGLQTNDNAFVLFRFLNHPEYLQKEMQLLLREGRTKVVGKITKVFPINDS